jgi:ABC-2 type transport system permease protein
VKDLKKQFYTVLVFTKIGTKRFFRDRLAIFFSILFPLIFLFVFGEIANGNSHVSFNVAVINQSNSLFSRQIVSQFNKSKIFKIESNLNTLKLAKNSMENGQIDGTILLSPSFGKINQDHIPSGTVHVLYTQNDQISGQTISTLIEAQLKGINQRFIKVNQPFRVMSTQLSQKSLTTFDYTFSGLLGFSIIGIGIFGPINVFPELKKQGILRRLHTTPLKVWQYFMATMFSQAITGVLSIGIQFIVALEVFHLKISGNYINILIYTILSIFMILGIGLAIGGWAKNERQAAPLSNIIVFPMLFLSGTFFPRFDMPIWLQKITEYLPLTPVIDGLRLLTTDGKNLLQVKTDLGLVLIWLIIVYIIAFKVFKWE